MRKTLSIFLSVFVLAGVFAGSWYLSGGGSGPEQAGPVATTDDNMTPDSSLPGSPDDTSGSSVPGVAGGTSGSSVPGSTNGTSGSFVPGVTGGTSGAADAPTALVIPPNFGKFARNADILLRASGVNPLAIGRVMTYASIAYHDTYRDNTIAPLLVNLPGGGSVEEALTAGVIVLAETSEVASLTKDAEGWLETLSPKTQAIVAAVLKRAAADGFAQALTAKAPKFTVEPAWKPGNRLYPGGFEPGWGQLKPILIDIAKCPVAKAPVAAIAGERTKVLAALKASDFDRNREEIANALLEGTGSVVHDAAVAFGTYNGTMKPFFNNDPLSPAMSMSLRALVGAYDTSIALWNAKWANGIASPMDLHLADSTVSGVSTPAPSYPSTASAMTTLVSHLLDIQGGAPLTDAELSSIPGIPVFKMLVDAQNARVLNWSADVQAGRDLGRCMAEQTYASLKR